MNYYLVLAAIICVVRWCRLPGHLARTRTWTSKDEILHWILFILLTSIVWPATLFVVGMHKYTAYLHKQNKDKV